MMDWNHMSFTVPDCEKLCLLRSYRGNYHIATYELFGRTGRWITKENLIIDNYTVTHWAYITPPNN